MSETHLLTFKGIPQPFLLTHQWKDVSTIEEDLMKTQIIPGQKILSGVLIVTR